jgi:hypothetical protein
MLEELEVLLKYFGLYKGLSMSEVGVHDFTRHFRELLIPSAIKSHDSIT